MKRKGWLLVLGGIVVLIIIYLATTYNSLVSKEENVKRYWGDLHTTYQRRNDLIPSLVAVVKASSTYEKTVLEQVATARAKASQLSIAADVNYQNFQQLEALQGELASSVNRAIAVVENYPDLKGTKNFLRLQSQLEGTERRIKLARKDFNQAVAEYNNAARRFPTNIAAALFGFSVKEGFTADAGASQAPEINFKQ
ncbi:MAG TPA: LemA family protein [Chitinophagaceae bacterium]|nr:LemA family protein [Chitinophagaceae bacterium]